MACQALLDKHSVAWRAAVSHTFLEDCRDGTIDENAFDAWLVQDKLFAQECVRFAAVLLSKAPVAHFDCLLGGMAAMKPEIQWFEFMAVERGLASDADPHPTCRRYCQFLANFRAQPYAVQALVWWAVERAYNEAWGSHCPMKEPYNTYAQRWGSAAFGDYVNELERQANEALAEAPLEQRNEAEVAFAMVCELERDFWDMAYDSTAFE